MDKIDNNKLIELIKENRCDLSNSNLTSLDDKLFSFDTIEELILCENKLEIIPQTIENLKNLKWLVLSDNNIVVLPENLSKLKKLEGLFVSNNKLKKLPANIVKLTNLKWLSLVENNELQLNKTQKRWIEKLIVNGCKVMLEDEKK